MPYVLNDTYFLAIINENGKLSGHLSTNSFDDDKNRFNPFTVFGDLMQSVFDSEYNGASDCEPILDDYSFKDSYIQHPFFKDEKLQSYINTYISWHKSGIEGSFTDSFSGARVDINFFIIAFMRIHKCFYSSESISLSEFEFVKAMNQYKFNFEIISGDNKNDSFFGSHYTPDKWQKYQKNNAGKIRFNYTCYSLEETIFAIWHYLIFHGYNKFNQCHHCGNYFSTNTLKQKYCNDNSPYDGYTHLDCEQAVRNIKQKLIRRRKVIYTNLFYNYNNDILYQFLDEYDKMNVIIKERSSVENLKNLENFLDKETVSKRWYTDENKKLSNTVQ